MMSERETDNMFFKMLITLLLSLTAVVQEVKSSRNLDTALDRGAGFEHDTGTWQHGSNQISPVPVKPLPFYDINSNYGLQSSDVPRVEQEQTGSIKGAAYGQQHETTVFLDILTGLLNTQRSDEDPEQGEDGNQDQGLAKIWSSAKLQVQNGHDYNKPIIVSQRRRVNDLFQDGSRRGRRDLNNGF